MKYKVNFSKTKSGALTKGDPTATISHSYIKVSINEAYVGDIYNFSHIKKWFFTGGEHNEDRFDEQWRAENPDQLKQQIIKNAKQIYEFKTPPNKPSAITTKHHTNPKLTNGGLQ